MMTTTGGDGPSVFAKYIDGPENARPAPLENLIKQSRRHADLKTFLMDVLIGGPVPVTLIVERGTAHGQARGEGDRGKKGRQKEITPAGVH